MNPRLILPTLTAAVLALPAASEAVTVNINSDREIQAIGGLVIGGVDYDVSFDGSFGQTIS